MTHRTQSTPHKKYIPPATPVTTVRTISIPAGVITALAFGCMAVAIVGALAGAFK